MGGPPLSPEGAGATVTSGPRGTREVAAEPAPRPQLTIHPRLRSSPLPFPWDSCGGRWPQEGVPMQDSASPRRTAPPTHGHTGRPVTASEEHGWWVTCQESPAPAAGPGSWLQAPLAFQRQQPLGRGCRSVVGEAAAAEGGAESPKPALRFLIRKSVFFSPKVDENYSTLAILLSFPFLK